MTDKDKTTPLNELEYLIDGASRDLVTIGTLWSALLRTDLLVMCDKEWDGRTADPSLRTLTMAAAGDQPELLVVFTAPVRAELALSKYPDYPKLVKVPGGLVLHQIGGTRGLVVNPGGAFNAQIAPDAIDKIKQAIGVRPLPANS